MKRSAALEAYYTHSGKASDQARTLALAGIGVVWIFKQGEGAEATIGSEFVAPLLLLVAGLALDFSQYVLATLFWGALHRIKEWSSNDITVDEDIVAPRWINWPAVACFWGKLAAVAAAYAMLIELLWARWSG